MTPLRIGFAGCGRVTASLHLPALQRVRGAVVTAVADTDPRRREEVGAAWGIARRHADVAALATDPEVDLIAVCVPPEEHLTAALEVLDAGRHLFVEKPLALSLGEADRLLEHPALADVVAAVGFNLRHHRQILAARRILGEGRLGTVGLLRTTLTSGIRLSAGLPEWRRTRARGGGVLWELAVHHADLWRALLGEEIVEVAADARGEPLEDDVATVSARAAGGTVVSGTFAQGTADANQVELAGDRAALRLDLQRGDGLRVVSVGRPGGGPRTRAREAAATIADLPRQLVVARRGGDFVASYAAQWHDVVDAVRTGRPPAATLADGWRATAIVAAAIRAADERRAVAIDERDVVAGRGLEAP